jgi:ABC-type ATPase involved in cell division
MIEELTISNFRAFSRPVTIRFRPITILVGKNSAGKSTLLKFLQMLRQTLESSDGDFLVTEGRHVQLGAFRLLQNRSPGYGVRRLRFEMRLRTLEGPSPAMLNLLDELLARNGQASESGNGFHFSFNSSREVLKADQETVFRIMAEALYREPQVGRHQVWGEQQGKEIFSIKAPSLRNVRFLSFPSNTSRPEGELEALARNSFLKPPREFLMQIRHLPPVRSESARVVLLSNAPEDDVGEGEFAAAHLYEILNKGGRKEEFVTKYIRKIANIDRLEFKQRARSFRSHFRGRNMDTGAKCFLSEFGFGVSQCLPIFVQGALLQRGQLLMVEQPEAQLHPTAQLGLGSFFAELWSKFGVPSLIETHSDNLMLRIRKLVAKGELKPEDVSIAYFHVESRTVKVKNLDVLEGGRLQEGLPMEFFGADLIEALDLEA